MRKIGYVIIIMVLIFSMGACGNALVFEVNYEKV